MSTFKELQEMLRISQYRKLVLYHLIDYLEAEFRPGPNGQAKKMIVNEEKVPVPDSAFESVITELLGWSQKTEQELVTILGMKPEAVEEKKVKKDKQPPLAPVPVKHQ